MAAEIVDQFGGSVAFVRMIILVAVVLAPDYAGMAAYALAALFIPHGGRRPGWSNLIGLWRLSVALLLLLGFWCAFGSATFRDDVFGHGPWIWIPVMGVLTAGLAALRASGSPTADRDAERDRRAVLVALPLMIVVAATAAGVVALPQLRWEFVLAALTLASGTVLLLAAGRFAPLVVPVAVLGCVTALFAAAGVRLQGGVGNELFRPTHATAIPRAYRRAIGHVTLDLTALAATHLPLHIVASVGIGRLEILVPEALEKNITVVERVGSGKLSGPSPNHVGLTTFDSGFEATTGIHMHRVVKPAAGSPSAESVRVEATVGFGEIILR